MHSPWGHPFIGLFTLPKDAYGDILGLTEVLK